MLLSRLEGIGDRVARFRTVIALKGRIPSGETVCGFRHTAEGVVEGSITTGRKGKQGFGYDPVFLVHSEGKTYAEMNLDEKNRISHRALALQNASALLSEIMKTPRTSEKQDITIPES